MNVQSNCYYTRYDNTVHQQCINANKFKILLAVLGVVDQVKECRAYFGSESYLAELGTYTL